MFLFKVIGFLEEIEENSHQSWGHISMIFFQFWDEEPSRLCHVHQHSGTTHQDALLKKNNEPHSEVNEKIQ